MPNAWDKRDFEALASGRLYRSEGDSVTAPYWVVDAVVRLRDQASVNMLAPELVAYFLDTGQRERNPALWILDHRDEYMQGIQHGFVKEPCDDSSVD